MVDYIMGQSYADIDLNETPVIVPSCGHLMTVESFDGHMGLKDLYELDANEQPISLLSTSDPFSTDTLKVCPMCRGALRDIHRYNRVVKRGLIDEATKKFIVWANAQFVPLEQELHTQEQALQKSKAEFKLPRVNTTTTEISLHGSSDQQTATIFKKAPGFGSRYKKIHELQRSIRLFVAKVGEGEQPFGRIHDMVRDIRRRRGLLIRDFNTGQDIVSKVLDTRNRILATALSIRCNLALLSDFVEIYLKQPANMTNLKVNLGYGRAQCLELVKEATQHNQPMQQIEAWVLFARFIAVERAAPADVQPIPKLVEQAQAELVSAKTLCRAGTNTVAMLPQIEAAEKMLCEGMFNQIVTNEEMRQVYSAMAREFGGTGHWYYCHNGHPFTIGECGMPMQTARCPQCGATIGGTSHRPVEGVQRAADLEEQFGRMAV